METTTPTDAAAPLPRLPDLSEVGVKRLGLALSWFGIKEIAKALFYWRVWFYWAAAFFHHTACEDVDCPIKRGWPTDFIQVPEEFSPYITAVAYELRSRMRAAFAANPAILMIIGSWEARKKRQMQAAGFAPEPCLPPAPPPCFLCNGPIDPTKPVYLYAFCSNCREAYDANAKSSVD